MHAPGHPGIPPTWTSSAKDMVGCSLGLPRLWFTTGYGIVNEVYYPRADIPQIRDLGFIVADGEGFWGEVKRIDSYDVRHPGAGIPALEIVHRHARYELRLRLAPDPQRDVLLVEVTLSGDEACRPYALLAPHLGGQGGDNRAEVSRYRGRRVLWAEQGPFGLALAAVDERQRDAWGAASAGYAGTSDGWQDFNANGALTWQYDTAGPGNVALIGELPRRATLALAFGTSKESAAALAYAALAAPFGDAWEHHVSAWRAWQSRLTLPANLPAAVAEEIRTSAMVLHVHQDKTYPGAMVASLSIPWGNSRDDTGGYHLVWPRDLVESAGALLALGAEDEARNVLRYLVATQHEDGHWSQNQWLGGRTYWTGIQLDEAAFPVLLAAALAERDALGGVEVRSMVGAALRFIALQGPITDQDRWEEDAGINPFTLAVCIAALVCGAQFVDGPAREAILDLADYWNARIEDWTVARDSALARAAGVDAHYIRVALPPGLGGEDGLKHVLPIKNRAHDPSLPAQEQVGGDFLQLVRLGLRQPDDALIRASLAVIDVHLKVDTPNGPAWHRYTGDGYGEHQDGAPFDGFGRGRAWPLLTGERGHYELAAGNDPLPYLEAMAAMTGTCGLIPEQVWDGAAIPQRSLQPGRPTGSAMPLVWAHAEFIKLAVSRTLGWPFDRPQALWQRYGGTRPAVARGCWTRRLPLRALPAGQGLRICLAEPATVHWGVDGWQQAADAATTGVGLGLHVCDLPVAGLAASQCIDFTFRRSDGTWEGQDYRVEVT